MLWIAYSIYFPLGICGGPERTEILLGELCFTACLNPLLPDLQLLAVAQGW